MTSMWMKQGDDTLVATAYGPNELEYEFEPGEKVRIIQSTDYPFDGKIEFSIEAGKPVSFYIMVRIPEWADGATVKKNWTLIDGTKAGEFFRVYGTWQDGDILEVRLPMDVRVTKWFNSSAAVERGPLVFALPIKEKWMNLRRRSLFRKRNAKKDGYLDFAVHPESDSWERIICLLYRVMALISILQRY